MYCKKVQMASKRVVTIRLPQEELDRLEQEGQRTGRTKTDILREFIRTLPRS